MPRKIIAPITPKIRQVISGDTHNIGVQAPGSYPQIPPGRTLADVLRPDFTNLGTPGSQSPFPVGSNAFDPTGEILEELLNLNLENQLARSEWEQRRAASEAEAAQQRAVVERQMGIMRDYQGLATGNVNEEYGQTIESLLGLIPNTEAAYAQGQQAVGQGYTSGQQNLNMSDLIAQIGAISDPSLQAEINDPVAQMAQLLGQSGQSAVQNLQTLGAGDVAAARNAIPGYRQEQQQTIDDIVLENAATLSELANELSMITPNFTPFNQGEVLLRTRRILSDLIRQQAARQGQGGSEEENFEGLRGAQQYAARSGRPDLYQELLDAIASSEQGVMGPDGTLITGPSVLYQILNNYEDESSSGSYLQPPVGNSGASQTRQPFQYSTGLGKLDLLLDRFREGSQAPKMFSGLRPGASKSSMIESARQRDESRRLLNEMYNIYLGRYQ